VLGIFLRRIGVQFAEGLQGILTFWVIRRGDVYASQDAHIMQTQHGYFWILDPA